ncbi:hypothetical protein SAMN02745168_1346 [Papillibacter cinnamivorans DSM 12816]|uniref:Uncharacterized protein n=1 Tax=Papillibacter cinnamivorans DSM 12816 TaxID=1122930 RepID=A0A1W1ZZD3_9FIRM|nr:hypothetical protein SAMN02745168_1346 [Papillibacter cinnamivorans DSM 12816]
MRRDYLDTMETAGSLVPDLSRAPSSHPHSPRRLESPLTAETEKHKDREKGKRRKEKQMQG